MAIAQRLILIIFCVGFSYGQRIPVALFEPVVITPEQQSRIITLDSIESKTLAQEEELALLYASTRAFEQSFDILSSLAKVNPDNYDYQFLLGGIAGTLASEVSQVKSLSYVRAMKTAFERAALIAPDSLIVQLVLLELYTELPWVLGGSNKKANRALSAVQSLSTIEGFLAAGYYYRTTKKNKEALVAYLSAVNEVDVCSTPEVSNDAYYVMGVLSFYLQKDITKALCFFEHYLTHFSGGDRYPKSFARHYIDKLTTVIDVNQEMEENLLTYDPLTRWIQNNFK
ncbi:MAG: tetratricopeptide repeat protein [Flavobacteriaceae bacterium]